MTPHDAKRAQIQIAFREHQRIAQSYLTKLRTRYRDMSFDYFAIPFEFRQLHAHDRLWHAYQGGDIRDTSIPALLSLLYKLSERAGRAIGEVCPDWDIDKVNKHFLSVRGLYYELFEYTADLLRDCSELLMEWDDHTADTTIGTNSFIAPQLSAWARELWEIKTAVRQGLLEDDEHDIFAYMIDLYDEPEMSEEEAVYGTIVKPEQDVKNMFSGRISHVSNGAFRQLGEVLGLVDTDSGEAPPWESIE